MDSKYNSICPECCRRWWKDTGDQKGWIDLAHCAYCEGRRRESITDLRRRLASAKRMPPATRHRLTDKLRFEERRQAARKEGRAPVKPWE